MKNRVLSILLALCFVVTLLPAAAFADSEPMSGTLGDNITWVFDNGTLTVSGSGEMEDCTWGAPWLELSDPITKVVITKGVTSVGAGAFYCCMGLKTVVLPESLETIDFFAFSSCNALESITLPDSLKTIGQEAFENCTSLKSITIPGSVTSIGQSAFYGCSSLTSVTIEEGVTSIGSYAFSGCTSLTSITFNGTKAQWNAISKDESWDDGTGAYTIHCTDGDIKISD